MQRSCATTAAVPRRMATRCAALDNQPLTSRAASLSGAQALTLPGRAAVGMLLSPAEALGELGEAAARALSASAQPQAALESLLRDADAALARAVSRAERSENALREALPGPLAALLPEALPAAVQLRPRAEPRQGSAATFSPGPPTAAPVFAGGVAANRVGSELERFTREARALREALEMRDAVTASSPAMAELRAAAAARRLRAHLREALGPGGDEGGALGAEGTPEEAAVRAAMVEVASLCDEADAALLKATPAEAR